MELRRQDRAVSELAEIDAILGRCQVGRIGLIDDGAPYVVPVSFAHRLEADQTITVVVHGAAVGRRQSLAGGPVCFEADRQIEVVAGPKACDFTVRYESVIGTGTVEVLADPTAKRQALACLVEKYCGVDFELELDAPLERMSVWSIRLDSVSGKHNLA